MAKAKELSESLQSGFSFEKIDESLSSELPGKISSLLEGHELSSFMLGCSFPKKLSDNEKKTLRRDFQFSLAQNVKDSLAMVIDYNNPDANITVDFNKKEISIYLKPLYILGSYRKFSRQISQTVFFCPKCKGRGCRLCAGKGVLPYESVQELVAKEALALSGASDNFFHGAGREDLDVRMLGSGRPFVLELSEPKKRALDLTLLEKAVNEKNKDKIEVFGLEFCAKEKIAEVKENKHSKVYSLIAESENEIKEENLQNIREKLDREISIFQRTPERVSGRRADLVRRRKAKIIFAERLSSNSLRINLLADHGLYIKEFVSSDSERSKPSLSSIAGIPLFCKELDVIQII